MVVNVGYVGNDSRFAPLRRTQPARPPVAAQRPAQPVMTTDIRKLYARISDVNQKANKFKADFDSAMNALSVANTEIDRLTAELATAEKEMTRLNAVVCQLNQDLAKARQKKTRGKKGDASDSED